MRCDKIHDLVYDDAVGTTEAVAPDVAYDPDEARAILAACGEVIDERRAAHGANDAAFCADYGCDQWGTVNRWTERVQRGW